MKIRFFDKASANPRRIASIEIAKLKRSCERLKLQEVNTFREAELVFGHFTTTQVRSLSGYSDFAVTDISNRQALLREVRTWVDILDAASVQELADAERQDLDDQAVTKKIVNVLNQLLRFPELTSKLRFDGSRNSDADFLISLGIENLHLNELCRLNRAALEFALARFLNAAKDASDWIDFPADQLIVFVTTQNGYPDQFPYQHSRLRMPDRTRRLLFAKDMTGLTVGEHDIDQVLSLTRTQLEQIILGNTTDLPRAAYQLFITEQPDLLQALLVLTIGYLSVYSAEGNQPIADQIGLSGALESVGPYCDELRQTLAGQQRLVNKRGWWLKSFGVVDPAGNIQEQSWKRFLDEVKQQWAKTGHNRPMISLESLLKKLYEFQEISSTELVLGAYTELVDRLGA